MKKISNIKTTFDNLFLESYEKKNNRLFGKLMKAFSNSEKIKKYYVLTENLLSTQLESESQIEEFINLNIREAKTIPIDEIEKFSESLPINEEIQQNPLLESVCMVLFETKNWLNFHSYECAYKDVVQHLQSNIKKQEKKVNLSEEEKTLLESVLKNPKEKGKETINECLEILNNESSQCHDNETLLKIFETKERLYKMLINDDIGYQTVVDLLKFKSQLLV